MVKKREFHRKIPFYFGKSYIFNITLFSKVALEFYSNIKHAQFIIMILFTDSFRSVCVFCSVLCCIWIVLWRFPICWLTVSVQCLYVCPLAGLFLYVLLIFLICYLQAKGRILQ